MNFRSKSKIILVGEMHGVKENPEFIRSLVESIGKGNIGFVAFEYPQTLQNILTNNSLELNDLLENNDIKMLMDDGRFSEWHLKLIKWLNENGIGVVCFDPAMGEWNERDKKMFEYLNKKIAGLGDKKAIVVAGNLHTKTESFTMDGQKYIPMGSYIKDAFSINLVYGSGTFFNRTRRQFEKTEDPKTTNSFYIPVAHATK